MLRHHYTCRGIGTARRCASAFSAALLLAGCSIGARGPATTGSIVLPVEVQRPLPPTLAYSDAARIGQAANAALWQAGGGAPNGWVNARTGSAGTLQADGAPARSADCRPFSTTVTSVGGVHQYSGALCRVGDARAVVKIAENGSGDS